MKRLSSSVFEALLLAAIVCRLLAANVQAQSRVYRGSVGGKHVEMRLDVAGNKVTGTYFYDQFKQDIKLEGTLGANSQLELVEGTGKRKTGKFVCNYQKEAVEDVDLECEWSRPDGTKTVMVFLAEQGVHFKSDTKIVPTLMIDRKTKAEVSYPQFVAKTLTPGMLSFNRIIESRVQKALKESAKNAISSFSFDTNYNVLFADDDKISIEFNEYSDVGAAHPNMRLWTVNYHVKADKELSLEDVFKPGDDHKTAIAEFVAKDINRRADLLEIDEARRTNRKPERREHPLMDVDQLPEMDTWAFTLKGLAVYFDFPHVMAVFTRTIVPYGVLTRYLRSDSIVPPVK